jgi:hypothetical protein
MRVWEYATPSRALGRAVVVIVRGGFIKSDRIAVVVWVGVAESDASTVIEVRPPTVGVPEIVPSELREMPVGSDPAVILHVYGVVPPIAFRPWLYGLPTRPLGRLVLVIVSGAITVML